MTRYLQKLPEGWMPSHSGVAPLKAEAALSLAQTLFVLWRRRGVILATVGLLVVVAVVAAKLLPPKYVAEGLLTIDTRQVTIPELQNAISGPLVDAAIGRTEARVLASRGLAERVARKLRLENDPEFNPTLSGADQPGLLAALDVVTPLRDWLIEQELLPRRPVVDRAVADPAWEMVLDRLQDQLNIRNDERSYALAVGFQGRNPETAAAIVNAIMEMYVAEQVAVKSKATHDANAWLTERLQELRHEVDEADRRMQEYLTSNALLQTRAGTVGAQQLNELNTQLTLARAARTQAEATLDRVRAAVRTQGSAAGASEVLASPLIQNLRGKEAEVMQGLALLSQRLGDRHPQRIALADQLADLRRKIGAEVDRVAGALAGEVESARAKEKALTARLIELQATAGEQAQGEIILNQLQKEADAKRTVYATFLGRVEQTAQMGNIQPADSRIITRAEVPATPSSPRLIIFVLLAVIGGGLAGVGLALAVEWHDDRFRSLEDITTLTGLLGLGAVPALRGRRTPAEGSLIHYVMDNPNSPVAETIRGIRVRLKGTGHPNPPKVVLVTSAEAGEGKSSFATALGRLSARDGGKILLIEGDLRRPNLFRMLNCPQGPALDDVLAGTADWNKAMIRDPDSGLYCLPARGGSANPQHLLESAGLKDLLTEVAKAFDLVIIDSPPVMRVADPILLAGVADAVIMVVSWKRIRRKAVIEAIGRLESAGRMVSGVVLSRVRGPMPQEYVYGGYTR